MRILIVEDNIDLAKGLAEALRQMDHLVETIHDGTAAKNLLKYESFDLVVLDLNLPGEDGFSVLDSLRRSDDETPVLILTARADIESKVMGLDLGADDYLAKPFELTEFEARVRALLRRRMSTASSTLRLGRIEIDLKNQTIFHGEVEINLTKRERGVFEHLVANRGKVLTKRQFVNQLTSYDDDVSESSIEIYVHRLRKKLPTDSVVISTIRGLGYRLDVV